MSFALLDIIDSNLQLWNATTAVQSPGYALLEGNNYRFGAPARSAARLHPRNINTRFWWQLNTESLQPALGPARHTADLVHAHLQQIHREAGEPEELVLAVSSSMQRDQLSLLLGIIGQCPFEAVALVNRSVALASLGGASSRQFHLEIQLHQSLVTELANEGGITQFQRSIPLPGCGLLQLQERLVATIAAAFIRQTRFDPRRKADTEQALYDALPAGLRALQQQPETNIEVNGYRARINRSELTEAGQRLFTSASEAMGTLAERDQILADPLVALLPGADSAFAGAQPLATDALPASIEKHQDELVQRGETLSYVTQLRTLVSPVQSPVADHSTPDQAEPGQAEPSQAEPVVPPTPLPTHVLLPDATALPLSDNGVELGSGVRIAAVGGAWHLDGDLVDTRQNQEVASPDAPLARGDMVTVGNQQFQLIEVQS